MKPLIKTLFIIALFFLVIHMVWLVRLRCFPTEREQKNQQSHTERYSDDKDEDTSLNEQLRDIRYYWCVGVGLVVVGLVCCKWVNKWLGISLVIPGFDLMVFAPSPWFAFVQKILNYFGLKGMSQALYNRLLNNLLILTSLTIVFLVGVWIIYELTSKLKSLETDESPQETADQGMSL